MPLLSNLVEETANNPGTSTNVNLGGAPTGRRSFAQEFSNGDLVLYGITDGNATHEAGIGTFVSGAPNVLQRTTVIWNSAGTTARLDFPGACRVYNEVPASKAAYFDDADQLILPADAADPTAALRSGQVAWKSIGRTDAAAASVVDFTWASTFKRIRLNYWGLTFSVNSGMRLRSLTAGVPDAGATDYAYTFQVGNGAAAAMTVGSASPAFIDLTGATLSTAVAGGTADIYPGAAAATFTCTSVYGGVNDSSQTIIQMVTARRAANGLKNGIRLFASSGTMTGSFLVEGAV